VKNGSTIAAGKVERPSQDELKQNHSTRIGQEKSSRPPTTYKHAGGGMLNISEQGRKIQAMYVFLIWIPTPIINEGAISREEPRPARLDMAWRKGRPMNHY